MIEADPLIAEGVRHGFFTRAGGVSEGLYDSLNIGLGSKDDRAKVMENRARAARRLGAGAESLALPFQHHSADAVIVENGWGPGAGPKGDAVVTKEAGIAIGISTADCGPVLFADAEARIIAAAHAGWRGALAGILESTVEAMEAIGAARGRTVAVLGPTISREAYEVGPEFREAFLEHDVQNRRFFSGPARGKSRFDLPAYIVHRLKGLRLGHVEALARCTYREEADFFSYRRATHRGESDYGRLVSAIALTP